MNKSEPSTLQDIKYAPVTHENDYPEFNTSNKKPDTLFLYLAVFSILLLIVVNGGFVVWTSPALVKLKQNDSTINPLGRPITTAETSMVAGLPILFGLIGMIVLPKLSDVIGRKRYLLLMGSLIFLSGVALALSKQVILIIIFHGLLGVFLFATWPVVPIYITEVCEDHNRGKFGCLIGFSNQLGHFFVFLIGPVFSIQNFTLISILPALVCVATSIFIPETPVYLLRKGNERECKRALAKLRNNKTNNELKLDFIKLEEQLEKSAKNKKAKLSTLIKIRENRIALMLALLPLITQHTSGIVVIMSFLAPFFNSAGTTLSGNTVAIIVSILKLSCITFTFFIVDRFGRRKMLLISSTGVVIPLFFLGVFFYLKHNNSFLLVYLQWLPLTGLLTYVFLYSIGLGCIPMAIVSELFTSELRAASGIIIHSTITIITLILSVSFPVISATIGVHWCVWTFSLCSLIGAVLIYFFLPETKGKSVIEIQNILKKY